MVFRANNYLFQATLNEPDEDRQWDDMGIGNNSGGMIGFGSGIGGTGGTNSGLFMFHT